MSNIPRFLTLATLVFGGGLFSVPVINGFVDNQQSQIELLIGLRIQFPENNFDNSTSGNENFILNTIAVEVEDRCFENTAFKALFKE